MANIVTRKQKRLMAIDVLVAEPDITIEQIASKVGVTANSVSKWLKDPIFIDDLYDKYMVAFNRQLPDVLNSMIREAKLGNVQAGRLVLEHSGKLIKRVNVKVDSPFEKFLKIQEQDAEDGEFEEIDNALDQISASPMDIIDSMDVEGELPRRDKSNDKPRTKLIKDNKKVKKIKDGTYAKEERKKVVRDQANKFYKIRERAKAVGLKPLPPGKPTQAARKKWMDELELLEKSQNK